MDMENKNNNTRKEAGGETRWRETLELGVWCRSDNRYEKSREGTAELGAILRLALR